MKLTSLLSLNAAFCSLLLASSVATAAPAGDKTAAQRPASSATQEAHRVFRDEMAFCASGQSVQGRTVCEKEARAAHAQNLRGALADGGASTSAQYGQNSEQRCRPLPPAERASCMMRVTGKAAPDAVVVVPGSEAPLQATTPPRQ